MKKLKNPNGYYGSSCRSGYQSHYTIVKERKGGSYPIETTNANKNETANELVVYQDPQAIPLFIISQKQLNWESIIPSQNIITSIVTKQKEDQIVQKEESSIPSPQQIISSNSPKTFELQFNNQTIIFTSSSLKISDFLVEIEEFMKQQSSKKIKSMKYFNKENRKIEITNKTEMNELQDGMKIKISFKFTF